MPVPARPGAECKLTWQVLSAAHTQGPALLNPSHRQAGEEPPQGVPLPGTHMGSCNRIGVGYMSADVGHGEVERASPACSRSTVAAQGYDPLWPHLLAHSVRVALAVAGAAAGTRCAGCLHARFQGEAASVALGAPSCGAAGVIRLDCLHTRGRHSLLTTPQGRRLLASGR